MQTLPSSQLRVVPAVQTPNWHVSVPLQKLTSGHAVPLTTGVLEHCPALHTSVVHGLASLQSASAVHAPGTQVSTVQALLSLQFGGGPAMHWPLWQVSAPLQTFPSSHGIPFRTGVLTQPKVALQVSAVQGLPSSQLSAVPGVQTPPWQTSSPSQALLSAQEVPFSTAALLQPKTGSQVSVVHTFVSSQGRAAPGVHTPVWQVSLPLQTLPSLHDVPFATGVVVQPKIASQPSAVQTLLSLQLRAVPAVQVPFWHVSVPLQTLASAHVVPFSTGALAHPKVGSQLSVVQRLPSSQLSAVPAAQRPAWQVSLPLQMVPSAQEVPLGRGAFEHPRTGPQVSMVHTLPSSHERAVPGVQTPLWHVSVPLQTSASTHGVPFTSGVCEHPLIGLQVSVVQVLLSLQLSAGPVAQTPLWQVSAPLHTLPSAHGVPLRSGVLEQPVTALQVSVVHTLPSLQLSATPGAQRPLWQVSTPLHAFPSLQDDPFTRAVLEQPVAGLQVSAVQMLLSLQLSGGPGRHRPL